MPIDEPALARSLKHLRAEPVDHNHNAVQSVVDAASAMFEADGAALLLRDGDDLVCVAATDDSTRAFEDAQVHAGQGPCRDAITSGDAVSSIDVGASETWPKLAATTKRHGIRAVLSAPVRLDDAIVGSLCVSARVVRRWSQTDEATITAYAAVVGGLLDAEVGLEHSGEVVEQLEHALVGRVLIEQAKGVLMARRGIGPGEAFKDMRQQARSERRKVTDVAREVLATTTPGHSLGELDERVLVLASVADAALANTELDALFADLLERLRDVLAVDAATVLLLTEDGQELYHAAAVGLSTGPAAWARIPVGRGVAGLVAATGNPVLIEDLQDHVVQPSLQEAELRGWAGAPLMARGRLRGVIEVGTREPRQLGPEILELLELVGERVALAIEHVLRFERERRARKAAVAGEVRAQFLVRSTEVITSATDDMTMLQDLADLIVPRLAEMCLISMIEQAEGSLRLRPMARATAPGVDEGTLEAVGNRYRLDLDVDEPLARAVVTGKGVVVAEVTDEDLVAQVADEEELRLRRALGVRSAVVVPLARGGRAVGVMTVASTDADRRYGPEDLAVMEDLGRLAGAVLA